MATVMNEVVYGTKEEGHVMSEKVSQLAASVYSEFEKMIKKYDEDVVKELMPLVVGILENLDQAYTEKQEAEVDQELLRDDNEQLLTQYEREKQLRKSSEQKYLEMEDALEEDRKVTDEKIESLESIVRMLELKTKNSSDHISRLEDKESELKKEYNKLHERYTELMRSHMDYMERAKILIGTDRIADMANSPRSSIDKGRKGSINLVQRSVQTSPVELGFNLPNLKPVNMVNLMSGSGHFKSSGSPPDANSFDMMSPRSGKDSNVSIRSEMSDSVESPDINSNRGRKVMVEMKTSDKEQNTDRIDVKESGTGTAKTTVEKVETPGSPLVKSENEPTNIDSSNKLKSTADTETQSTCDKTDEKSATESDSGVSVDTQGDITKDSGIGIDAQSDTTKETVSVTDLSVSAVDRSENVQILPKTIVTHERTSEQTTKTIDSIAHKTKDEFFEDHLVSPVSPISPHSPQFECSYEEDYIPGALDVAIAQIVATTPEIEEMEQSGTSTASANNNTKQRMSFNNTSSIFDELTSQDADLIGDVDIGADITGRAVNPADYASSDSEDEQDHRSTVSDNFFGMGKELENLILENTELLATKNALNIVKDDLIAKVDELSSEQEILREEINSLQAVKTKLQGRIKDLEEDLKKTREDLEKKNQAAQEQENEDEVPMAQRKRFTRVEMARVLMERNQYKERLMELQEAVRWTEMIRASREHPEINPSKKKSSIWNFFSNLFSSSPNKPSKKPLPVATVKYNAPTTNVQPVGDPNQTQRGKYNLGDKSKAYDFLQDDLMRSLGEPIVAQPNTSEKARKEREKERKEQYKQVRAHVKKDDGRMQAYGWSLPAKFQPQIPNAAATRSSVSVPVPVYCRPLLEAEQGLKIWCAAGVNLTGGKTKDGGSIVGASVFYENPPESETQKKPQHDVDRLDKEITDHQESVKNADKEQLCSFVWICTSTQTESRASVIDANNPGDILQTFRVSRSPVLCIASVPGALESDYPVDEDILNAESYPQYPTEPDVTASASSTSEDSGIGGISFVQCATGEHVKSSTETVSNPNTPPLSRDGSPDRDNITSAVKDALGNQSVDTQEPEGVRKFWNLKLEYDLDHAVDESWDSERRFKRFSQGSILSYEKRISQSSIGSTGDTLQPTVFKAKGSPATSGRATPEPGHTPERRVMKEPSEQVKDGISSAGTGSDLQDEEVEKMSSVLPTMWIGAQSGSLFVHSSVSQWRRCLHSVKLRDSVLNIVHVKGRVLAALADGTVAIFHRDTAGQWDLQNYHLLDLGKPHHSIRCMTVIANKHVWCGYRNKIHVVDPKSMSIQKSFDAHPRKESQVRQLAWLGDGVWVSIRLDSTLRLYHAYTHQHLQDVDIEPYVSKMLGTGKLGFSFVRITSMLISSNRLWIGTGNGVIISVPLSEGNKQHVSMGASGGRPGGIVRVYADNKTESVTPGSFIPYCTMAQAQLSFHGHRDAVKFFVAVPASAPKVPKQGKKRAGVSAASQDKDESPESSETRLVLSGGEGYVDFRIGDGDDDIVQEVPEEEDEDKKPSLSKGERSHLIVWEVSLPH